MFMVKNINYIKFKDEHNNIKLDFHLVYNSKFDRLNMRI